MPSKVLPGGLTNLRQPCGWFSATSRTTVLSDRAYQIARTVADASMNFGFEGPEVAPRATLQL
jgi:hypothetical protein